MVHCRGNRLYNGVITRVTPGHIYVRTQPVGYVSSNQEDIDITTLENSIESDIQAVQWGYGYGYGRAAITTLALYDVLAISLFAW